MKRTLLTLFTPPVAVCKFGCAGCCAAPISVFWLAGMAGILYGLVGGPANLMGPSWNTVLFGFGMWGIAVVWAAVAILGANDAKCAQKPTSRLCGGKPGKPVNQYDESDPFDEVRKAR